MHERMASVNFFDHAFTQAFRVCGGIEESVNRIKLIDVHSLRFLFGLALASKTRTVESIRVLQHGLSPRCRFIERAV